MNKKKQAYFEALFYGGNFQEFGLMPPLLELRKWIYENKCEKDFAVEIGGFEIKMIEEKDKECVENFLEENPNYLVKTSASILGNNLEAVTSIKKELYERDGKNR